MKKNPNLDPEHFGLEMLEVEDPKAEHSFDSLCFWATRDGRVYTASDAGCSCPTPFEDYESETVRGLLPRLERVGSMDQAERIFDVWNVREYPEPKRMVSHEERTKTLDWVKQRLRP